MLPKLHAVNKDIFKGNSAAKPFHKWKVAFSEQPRCKKISHGVTVLGLEISILLQNCWRRNQVVWNFFHDFRSFFVGSFQSLFSL